MFSQEYNHPPFLVKSIASSNATTSSLAFGQVGLFNQSNFAPVDASTLGANDFVFFATGSFHTTDALGAYNQGLKQSIKSIFFRPSDVLEIRKSSPITAVNESMILGWDGVSGSTCQSLSFTAGTTYRFQVRVWGEDVYSTYLHPVVRTFTMVTDCDPSPNCTTGCVGSALPVDVWTKKMTDLINNDVELQKFILAENIFNVTNSTAASFTTFNLTIADSGDELALAAIQSYYASALTAMVAINPTSNLPLFVINRTTYAAPYSTYAITISGTTAPSAYTAVQTVSLASCGGTCPTGWTATAAQYVYTITRPLNGTENFTTAATRSTYASGVANTYNTAGVVSGTVTGYSFENFDAAGARILVTISSATAPVAVSADTIAYAGTRAAVCTSPSSTSVAWASASTYYQTSRTMCITLPKTCGTTGSNLAAVQAYYSGVTSLASFTVYASSSCAEQIRVTQYSVLDQDGCGTIDNTTYGSIAPYQAIVWTVCPCNSTLDPITSGATQSGIKITTAYQTPEFGPSFLPTDYFNVKPFHIDIQQIDDTGNACQTFWASKTLQRGVMATQTGHYVAREYAQAMAYQAYSDIFTEVRMQEVLDQLWFKNAIDKTAAYTVYYVKVRQARDYTNSVRDYSPEIFEYPFFIKNGDDTVAFENLLISTFSKFGKNLLIK